MDAPFWETTALEDMSEQEWESLCDGCGRCCLQKLEDIDTAMIFFTSVSCRLLDTQSCRCKDYKHRKSVVPDCTLIRPLTAQKRSWLPDSCAYRRVSEGRGLADWHPLVSGSPETVHLSGVSVRDYAESELQVSDDDYQERIIDFNDVHSSK